MASSVVSFTNSTTMKIYGAYMRADRSCLDDCGDWYDVLGWINLDPGETETRANPSESPWFYYYAERADGVVYGGDYPAEVADFAFEKCTCLGVISQNGPPTSPYYTVGFDELNLDEWGGVDFTP